MNKLSERHREIFREEFFWADSDISYGFASSEIWNLCKERIRNLKNILDLGCGPGTLLLNLCREFRGQIVGLDLSPNRCLYAKITNPSCDLLIGNALGGPFKDGIFDAVLTTQLIEHVDDKKLLKEINRVLKDKGILILGTVYRTKPKAHPIHPEHLREYSSLEELTIPLKENGFETKIARITAIKFSPIDRFFRDLYNLHPSKYFVELPKHSWISELRLLTKIKIRDAYFLEIIAEKTLQKP